MSERWFSEEELGAMARPTMERAIEAIDAGDPDEAQKHLRTHLSGTLSELARIRARYPEYLSD